MDSIDDLQKQIYNYKMLLNSIGSLIMDEKKVSKIKEDIKKIENNVKELTEVSKKFNSVFSDYGWITYDYLNTDLMKQAIKTYEVSGIDKAEELLLEYYRPENLKFELIRLKSVPEIINRYRLIEYAYNDYKEKKYYSVIPLILMVIDGAVYDVIGKGFHAEEIDLNVWDSITNENEGMNKIRDIFKKGRRKTTKEAIDLPYRNGILHGIDLGYDNYKVAAKCWHFLFITRDWILSKKTEKNRKAKFEEDKKIPTFEEIAGKLKLNKEIKSNIANWKPREITKKYIDSIDLCNSLDESLPEFIVVNFINLWIKKNYGYMAKLYSTHFNPDLNRKIIEVREQFENLTINSFRIFNIIDIGPGISEVEVLVKTFIGETLHYNFRVLYEGEDGFAIPRNLKNGFWKIIDIKRIN